METKNIIAFMPEYVLNSTLDAMLILQIKGKIARGENVLVGMSFNRETTRIEVRDTETLTYLGSLLMLDADVLGQCMSKGSCMGQIYLIEGSTIYIKAYILDEDVSDEESDEEEDDDDEMEFEDGIETFDTIYYNTSFTNITKSDVESFINFIKDNSDEDGCWADLEGIITYVDDSTFHFHNNIYNISFDLECLSDASDICSFFEYVAKNTKKSIDEVELTGEFSDISWEDEYDSINFTLKINRKENSSTAILANKHQKEAQINEFCINNNLNKDKIEQGIDVDCFVSMHPYQENGIALWIENFINEFNKSGKTCKPYMHGYTRLDKEKYLIFVEKDTRNAFSFLSPTLWDEINEYFEIVAKVRDINKSKVKLVTNLDDLELSEDKSMLSFKLSLFEFSRQIPEIAIFDDIKQYDNEEHFEKWSLTNSTSGEEESQEEVTPFTGLKDTTILLVGFQYHTSECFFENIKMGDAFVLAKEPNNPVDTNAIAAYKNGRLRAYVQKDDAKLIQNLVDVPRECIVVQLNEKSVKVVIPKYED